ncbi:hypothetical protein HN911_04775 [Candidatus Bathyarchaeota archaeon]|mgnify:FL=1|jgi:DNA modification methylase|nr:hypothetical protein [Candidatus Bathyarchaeota archaeon]
MKKCRMENLPVFSIDMGDRARKDYKNVEELWAGIQERGLLHPVAVYERPEEDLEKERAVGIDPKPFLLLAGGRRYMAHAIGGAETIPANIYEEPLNPLEIKELELMENIDREDLSYAEDSDLKAQIHALQVEMYGEAAGPSGGASIRKTAELLNVSVGALSEDIELDKAIKKDPKLGQLGNKTEAKRAVKRMKADRVREEVAKRHQAMVAEGGGEPAKNALIDSFVVGDFFEKVKQIPDHTFHVVEVDPPYGIDLKKVKQNDTDRTALERYNEVPKEEYEDFMARVFTEAYRVIQEDGWIVCWLAIHPWYQTILDLMTKAGFNTYGLPNIWYKTSFTGQTRNPEVRFGSVYEPYFFGRKGKAILFKQGQPNVHPFNPVPSLKKVHPTERPIEMISDVLVRFTPPAGRVLVPFAGSGNTLLAAANMGMKPLGFDLTLECKNAFVEKVQSTKIGDFTSYG